MGLRSLLRRNRTARVSLVAAAVVVVVAGAFGLYWFQPWKLFTHHTVDEAAPVVAVAASSARPDPTGSAGAVVTVPPSTPPSTPLPSPSASGPTDPATPAPAPADPTTTLADPAPPSDPGGVDVAEPAEQSGPEPAPAEPAPAEPAAVEPLRLGSGAFISQEHETTGTATVLQLPDGSRYLRLADFSTSDGPDVRVWLTDQEAGGDDWHRYDDGRYVELGPLKGTDGNQNYAIPADVDLSGLRSVAVWCIRFGVSFGSAPLS